MYLTSSRHPRPADAGRQEKHLARRRTAEPRIPRRKGPRDGRRGKRGATTWKATRSRSRKVSIAGSGRIGSARDISDAELRELARAGAQRRVLEFRDELVRMARAFPDVVRELLRTLAASPPPLAARPARKRPRMSAAQRKAVSERMRKYWATRRAKGRKRS